MEHVKVNVLVLFNDIVSKLLSLPNCAIVVGQGLFYENLHKTVREHHFWIEKLRHNILEDEIYLIIPKRWKTDEDIKVTFTQKEANQYCDMIKQQLHDILLTYDKLKKQPPNTKRRK